MRPYHCIAPALILAHRLVCLETQAVTELLDTSFRPEFQAKSGQVMVWRVRELADGRLLVGGIFDSVDGLPYTSLVRLHPDGSVDTSFKTAGAFPEVSMVSNFVVQADGRIVVVGYFESYDSQPVNNVIRLNEDGSRDMTFNTGKGPVSPVFGNAIPNAIFQQKDGKLVFSGYFEEWDGTTHQGLVRLNPDGSIDESYQVSLKNPVDGPLNTWLLDMFEDGRTFASVGGDANASNSVLLNNQQQHGIFILNQDGTKDESFNVGVGADYGTLNGMTVMPDGRYLLSGFFNEFSGYPRSAMVLLERDGSVSKDFVPPVFFAQTNQQGDGASTGTSLVLPNGKILVSGIFSSADDLVCNSFVRLNPDGSVDREFSAGNGVLTEDGQPGMVLGMSQLRQGGVVAWGLFETFDGLVQKGLVRLNLGNSNSQPSFTIDRIAKSASGVMEITLSKRTSIPVLLQASADLKDWSDIARDAADAGTRMIQDVAADTFPRRFYRLRAQ